jgi:hypothetical protein
MTEPELRSAGSSPSGSLYPYGQQSGANLADILERVLDKGIVIVGDIKVNLLDIELLTIKLRLLVASVDKAKEIGIDWWEHDPALSSRASTPSSLEEQNKRLRAEVRELRRRVEQTPAELPPREPGTLRRSREADRSREIDRPRATNRSRETDRPRETDHSTETDHSRETRRDPGAEPRPTRRRPRDDEGRGRAP